MIMLTILGYTNIMQAVFFATNKWLYLIFRMSSWFLLLKWYQMRAMPRRPLWCQMLLEM
jgi:hypothetical protein